MQNRLIVYFDEGCGPCTKVKIIMSFLRIGRCEFKFAKDMKFDEKSDAMINRYNDLYCFDGISFYSGYDTYLQIFKRSFLLYPIFLFMKITFIRKIGNQTYRKIADNRKCQIE